MRDNARSRRKAGYPSAPCRCRCRGLSTGVDGIFDRANEHRTDEQPKCYPESGGEQESREAAFATPPRRPNLTTTGKEITELGNDPTRQAIEFPHSTTPAGANDGKTSSDTIVLRSFDITPPVCPLGATAEAGCSKPDQRTGACAFTGKPAGHARMPPGPRQRRPSISDWGFDAPRYDFDAAQQYYTLAQCVTQERHDRGAKTLTFGLALGDHRIVGFAPSSRSFRLRRRVSEGGHREFSSSCDG